MQQISLAQISESCGVKLPHPEISQGHEDNITHQLRPILEAFGYDWLYDVKYKPQFTHAILGTRREADLGILRYKNNLYGIAVDLKTYGERLTESMVEKVAGYCGLAGAPYGILTNGVMAVIIKLTRGVVEWEYKTSIPTKQELKIELQIYKPTTSPDEQTHALCMTVGLKEDYERLWKIATPVRDKGRADKNLVEHTILELCKEQYIPTRVLAGLLQRKYDSVRNHYISPMLERGLLELRYPGQLNHPQQAYKTASREKLF